MNCRAARNTMTRRGSDPLPRSVRDHLDRCAACARFAERLEAAERVLAQPASEATPDPGFERRVRARLETEEWAPLGWAALRLLPASLLLVLVLLALAWTQEATSLTASAQAGDTGAGDDVLTWVLEGETSP